MLCFWIAAVLLLITASVTLTVPAAHADYGAKSGVSRAHSTYVSFGNRGDRLVATYHGDHAYAFDVFGAAAPPTASFAAPAGSTSAAGGNGSGRADSCGEAAPSVR